MPSCSHSCRALALERVKVHMAITAARYTRQETLPVLLLRYCPIFSLGWSAFVVPLKPRILELRRPSRYMEASYMEARVYPEMRGSCLFQVTRGPHQCLSCHTDTECASPPLFSFLPSTPERFMKTRWISTVEIKRICIK